MRKILVLGGTNYFGKKLVQRLLKNDDRVTLATRESHDDGFGMQVDRLKIDREDKQSMMTAFEGKNWDLVYDQSCL
ncbi:NAD-dependent epimerase/dehydratase family protein [Bacillus sp. SJS]|nr:NAD-dependent epimerase/dehydratase family protein [Bacillus sp. SJS]KZZ83647.1 hypothetical protein AS29_015185 [Bacillus sp. SJS]